MNDLWLAFLIYVGCGIVTNFYLVIRYDKKGKALGCFMFGDGDPMGAVLCMIFWPFIAAILAIELTFSDEKKESLTNKKKEIVEGTIGVTQTKMNPSGRVQVDNVFIDAYSVSGSLGIGESVEILSKEMNYYKVRKVEQDEYLNG